MKRRKKFLCHDPESECRVGDLVMIRECQRLSKRKHFTVAEMLEKSPAHLAEIEEQRARELQSDSDTTGGSSEGSFS